MNAAVAELSLHLAEQGFVVVPAAVPAELCEAALAATDAFKARNAERVGPNLDEFGRLYRVVNLHLAVPELAAAFEANGEGLGVCDEFFGEPAALYTSLYYERGSEQALHRDTPYFCTRPAGRYLGVWLALDDVDDDNGPLQVVPGSHRLPAIDLERLRTEIFGDRPVPPTSAEGWDAYQGLVQAQCRERGMHARNVHVQKGDVIIWHPEMLHGGAAHSNRQRSRRSLVMHVTPVGTPVYHMDVFYNPDSDVPSSPRWNYQTIGTRKMAAFNEVDFGHQYVANVADLI